ncbi:hypothetical protein [Salicibibacter halophilus]|uniref:hypothetical protein n=1 Tax=Salicibibacter halophilus TaxID=2502791 RepID=UPI0013568EC6|nr:hypothetical protein [Salicibibacter halophilus]
MINMRGMALQWRDSSGKTDEPRPRSADLARGGLAVRPRKAKPWKRHPALAIKLFSSL